MTQIQFETFACPNCGSDIEARIHSSVNVTLDPDLRDEVMSDRLNTALCPNCGTPIRVVTRVLYHDMTRRIAIWFAPDADEAEPVSVAGAIPAALGNKLDYLTNAPLVGDWERFKAMILQREEVGGDDNSGDGRHVV